MIKASDAIRAARSLIGTPYSELDCINLIKKVIRTAPGGVKDYTTAGTNALWRSHDSAEKYRDLTRRQTGFSGAQAGMLAFKADGEDYHHVGLVTGEGTVIHSSSTQGGRGVVETPLTALEGWTHLAVHRYIETSSVGFADTFPKGEGLSAEESEGNTVEVYKAVVKLNEPDSKLNVRNEPGTGGDVIGKLVHGQNVTVQAEFENGWAFVSYGDSGSGYVASRYLQVIAQDDAAPAVESVIEIEDDAGNTFRPVGGFTVRIVDVLKVD